MKHLLLPYPAAHVLFCLLTTPLVVGADEPAEEAINFTRDIRPILSETCFACHGPDEAAREADLRLDVPGELVGTLVGDDATLIVAGKPDQSELLRRLTSDDVDARMPPKDFGKPLSSDEIDKVRRWIAAGARWRDHWSFVPPERPDVPAVENDTPAALSDWTRNSIDHFVLRRLAEHNVQPSAEADKLVLLRRVSLDLVGLPPSLEEVDAFLADTADGAYDRLVERLLTSPHYGERWGRHWLDAARYADSDGYEKDKSRQVWFYRDWVINALNRDLPYDAFIIQQIAGDLLPDATQDTIVATGFLRNSMINEEGGIDPEQFRMAAMFDRMDAIGKAVLGITIQCAQCHSHKYDPLTRDEYYRMFAFINNSHEATMAVYTPPEQQRREEIFADVAAIETRLKAEHPDWTERLAAWEAETVGNQPEWTVLSPVAEEISTGGQKYHPLDDGSLLAQGYAPTKHRVQLNASTDLEHITGFRLELLTDPNLPRGGPGRSIFGTGALTQFDVEAAPVNQLEDAPVDATKVAIASATADVNPAEADLDDAYNDKSDKKRITGPIAFAFDERDETAWTIDNGPGRRNVARKAVFVAATPIDNAGGSQLAFYLEQNHGGWNSDDNQNNNLGRFRISVTSAENPTADPLPAEVREILAIPTAERTDAQQSAVFSYWRITVDEFAAANSEIESLWQDHPEGNTQLVLNERDERRATHHLDRGDFLKPLDEVTPDVPAFLNPLSDDARRDRLTFARWLVARDAPTTARALVNRVWQTYFGTGLVATPEELGAQGETPSHPELLDWLAVELMEGGWSLKSLHRQIVTSATYRQASVVTPRQAADDPDNRLLSRGPRGRVEAEVVRDIALTASGLLTREIGGPSVHPPAPAFLFQRPASYGPKIWNTDEGADRYRRGLYTFRFRSVPYPALDAFDSPNGDQACVRRTRSNTPLQALTTLNEPLFFECAQALALETIRAGGSSDAERLSYAFRRCLTRAPSDDESQVLLALLQQQHTRLGEENGADDALAWQVAVADVENKPQLPAGTTAVDLASWTLLSRVLLNLDETITKQ
jgi:mono/diheme cytochrome c family protein